MVEVFAVGPFDVELVVSDGGGDIEEVATGGGGAAFGASIHGGWLEGEGIREGVIELAEVVEADLGLGEGGEAVADGWVVMEVAEEAEAEAVLGDAVELLLDSSEG